MSEQIDLRKLAQDVVNIPGFTWVPGMHNSCVGVVYAAGRRGDGWVLVGSEGTVTFSDTPLPSLSDSGTQGCLIKMIADNNHRRSIFDAIQWVHWHMGRGLSFPEALVAELRRCADDVPGACAGDGYPPGGDQS